MRVKNQVIKKQIRIFKKTQHSPKHSEGKEEACEEAQKRHRKETVLLFSD